MNFASPIFLFAFLPLVLIAYHLLRPIRAKNVLLIAAGLVFYAFGDLRHLPLLLASCALHYGVGLALMRARRGRRLLLAACVTVDLAVLAAYKWHGALPLVLSGTETARLALQRGVGLALADDTIETLVERFSAFDGADYRALYANLVKLGPA